MALDGEVVGWIGEDQLGMIARHQTRYGTKIPGVPTEQAVAAQAPEVAAAAHRWRFRLERRHLIGGRVVAFTGRTFDQEIDLWRSKAGHSQIEVELESGNLGQLQRQQFIVPAGQLGQPIVSEDIGALLRRGHMVETNGRHPIHAEQPGSRDSTMASDHSVSPVDQDGVGETEEPNAVGNLSDLKLAMGARVPRIGAKRLDGSVLDPEREHCQPLFQLLVTVSCLGGQNRFSRKRLDVAVTVLGRA